MKNKQIMNLALLSPLHAGFPITGMNCGDYVPCMQVSFLIPLGLVCPSWKIKIHFAPSFTMARLAHCKVFDLSAS